MTEKQKEQFNRMLITLRRIAKDYMTTNQLKKSAEVEFAEDYENLLEMSYENIQQEARAGSRGIRNIK